MSNSSRSNELFNNGDDGDDELLFSHSGDDEDDQQDASEDNDEQHTQKINSQLESLQLKLEELNKELLIEKASHEETKFIKIMNEKRYEEEILQNRDLIRDLKDKSMKTNINSLHNDLYKFCVQMSLPTSWTTSEITVDTLSHLLTQAASTSKREPREFSVVPSRKSSLGVSIHADPNSQYYSLLHNEFAKFCLKVNFTANGAESPGNTGPSNIWSDEKCIFVLQKAAKVIVENTARIKNLETELRLSLNASEDIRALKAKLIQLVERIRVEKEHKVKAENDTAAIKLKLDMLSSHIEKLMTHLKHEATSKLRIAEQLRTSEREYSSMKDTCEAVQKKSAAKDRLILELREGSKILEDQLRLMDEKYLELRSKLDWARQINAIKLKKAEKKATDLRVKYALTTNSSAMLDHIRLPELSTASRDYSGPMSSGMSYTTTGSKKSARSIHSRSSRYQGDYDDRKEPSMDHVLEKLRMQENKKREWTEDKIRKLVESG